MPSTTQVGSECVLGADVVYSATPGVYGLAALVTSFRPRPNMTAPAARSTQDLYDKEARCGPGDENRKATTAYQADSTRNTAESSAAANPGEKDAEEKRRTRLHRRWLFSDCSAVL